MNPFFHLGGRVALGGALLFFAGCGTPREVRDLAPAAESGFTSWYEAAFADFEATVEAYEQASRREEILVMREKVRAAIQRREDLEYIAPENVEELLAVHEANLARISAEIEAMRGDWAMDALEAADVLDLLRTMREALEAEGFGPDQAAALIRGVADHLAERR